VSRSIVIVPAYGLEGVRASNCDRVLAHLNGAGLRTFTVAPLTVTTMGQARNLGAELTMLEPDPAEVLVFNDADSVVPSRQILRAVEWARQSPGLVYAYDLYLRLDADGRIEQELFAPPSAGCIAISRAAFGELGGFDVRFQGWGYEDVEFATRAQRLWPIRRVSGILEHLWHGSRRADDSPADSDPELVERNRQLWISSVRETAAA
jgi:hypothetical protein